VALGVLGAPAARAEIDPGPAFELDAPVRAEAWGDQWDPRVAAGPEGSLVMWVNRVILETSVTFSFAGALLKRGSSEPVPLAIPSEFQGWPWDIVFAGSGFFFVQATEAGIEATRLSRDGEWLDAKPRLLVAGDAHLVDVGCHLQGRCLLVSRVDYPGDDMLQTTSFGWEAAASPPSFLAFALADNGSAAVAARSDGFVAVYATDDDPLEDLDPWLRAQRFDVAGLPLGLAVELDTDAGLNDGARDRFVATDDGYALTWGARDGDRWVTRIGRLDAGGELSAAAELPYDAGAPLVMTSMRSDAVLFWSDYTAVSLLTIGPDASIDDRGVVGFVPHVAVFDGSQHLLVNSSFQAWADGEDVFGAWLDDVKKPIADPFLVSGADNSQWDAVGAHALDGDSAFVAWHDNRNDESDVVGVALGPDGCPSGNSVPIFAGEGEQTAYAIAPASEGFFVLGTQPDPEEGWRWLMSHVDPRGRELREPLEIPGAIRGWPNPHGGFMLSATDEGLVILDPDGTSRLLPGANLGGAIHAGLLDGDEAFVVWNPDLSWCSETGPLAGSGFRIDFVSQTTGAATRPPIVEESGFGPCSLTVDVFLDADGYIFAGREYGDVPHAFAARLGMDGAWSGRVPMASDVRGAPLRVREELWWLAPNVPAVRRTTLDFVDLGVVPLPAIELHAPALLATRGLPILLGERLRSHSLRLSGYRFDGGECVLPEVPSLEEPDATLVGACRAARGGSQGAWWILACVWLCRRRR